MSDLVLQGILRMPANLWTGDDLDIAQRHARYVQAADRIEELSRWSREAFAQLNAAVEIVSLKKLSKWEGIRHTIETFPFD